MAGDGSPRGEVECLEPESDMSDGGPSAESALERSDTAGEGNAGSIWRGPEEKCELIVRD